MTFESEVRSGRSVVPNLKAVELKAFVPAKDYAVSKRFYEDLGFVQATDFDGIAYFHHGEVSFLLQDFHVEALASNLMLHLLVEDVDAWRERVDAAGLVAKYGVKVGAIEVQPWKMRDFTLTDPSGVLWRIAQNV
jgi:catechol 2,3-dioxygenase-like lactoylglutathione lyase family enzyme